MESQFRCFTCGTNISGAYRDYLRYQDDPNLRLGNDDALDKAQVVTQCCRMTLMGHSNVAERVRAAGRPVTEGNRRIVVDVEDYPAHKPKRNAWEDDPRIIRAKEPEEGDTYEVASFTTYVNIVKPIPKETVVKTPGNEKLVRKPVMHEFEKKTAKRAFESSNWNMAEPASYPFQEDADLVFSTVDVVYRISAHGAAGPLIPIRIPGGTLLKDVLKLFTEFILIPREPIYRFIMVNPKVRIGCNQLLQFFFMQRKENEDGTLRYPSIYEARMGRVTIKNVEFAKGSPSTIWFVNDTSTTLSDKQRAAYKLSSILKPTGEASRVSNISKEADGVIIEFENRATITAPSFALHREDNTFRGEDAFDEIDDLIGRELYSVEYSKPEFLGTSGPSVILIAFAAEDDKSAGIIFECLGDLSASPNLKHQQNVVQVFPAV